MADILFARIRNSTNENIMVYGPHRPDDVDDCTNHGRCDNSGYILKPGQVTPFWWDCDGFYLPNDRYFVSPEGRGPLKGPAAIKYSDTKVVEIKKEGENYKCSGDKDDGFFRPGQINWSVEDRNAASYQGTFDPRYDVPN